LPKNRNQANRIIHIVDRLRELKPPRKKKLENKRKAGKKDKEKSSQDKQLELELDYISTSFERDLERYFAQLAPLEQELNEAVFDLYELRVSERDLIRDMCDIGLEFLYESTDSKAAQPIEIEETTQKYGVLQDISPTMQLSAVLKDYLTVFLKLWNPEIYPEGEFSWQIVLPNVENTMICVVFTIQQLNQRPCMNNDLADLDAALNLLDDSLLSYYNGDEYIYLDGIVRAVTENHIIVIKRNEMRLWTKSMAREDAEATLLQAIRLQNSEHSVYA
jgi:hypothetical protein